MSKRSLLIVLLIVTVVEITILTGNRAQSPLKLQSLTKTVLTKCTDAPYKPGCYEEEVPKLMDKPYNLSMEDAFKVVSRVQQEDKQYAYCHVLGHALSAKETKKDPSKWHKVAHRCPSGICSNGCVHGSFQERFRTEKLTNEQINKFMPEFKYVCEKSSDWNPTGMEQATCYHALGHLMMYVTGADTSKSTQLCDKTLEKNTNQNLSRVCYDGVYMQIFQPLEPEDFALIKGKQPNKETVLSFCNAFPEAQRASCLNESWPLVIAGFDNTQNIVEFCSRIGFGGPYVDRCYSALFYIATVQLNFDEEKLNRLCADLPQDRIGQCFANVASRMIETDWKNSDRSLRICAKAAALNVEDKCYQEMVTFAYFNFHPGSQEQKKLCVKLPEPWQTNCIHGKNQLY